MNFDIKHPNVGRTIENALAEDVGAGDVTTDACISASLRAEGRFVARQAMTVAGAELLTLFLDSGGWKKKGGDGWGPGEKFAPVGGAARALLTRERVSLNFLQR